MATELRKTGISVVADMPWGTHFCHFYETKQDLLDTLVPYFKAGLESKEYCLWVVSDSGLITVEEAKGALAQAVPDLDRHLSEENIEILNGHEWYFEKNVLTLERVASAWDAKVKRALARGYDGLRASADTFWLAEKDWKDFFAYEKQVNEWITDQTMTVLCTYPLAKSGAAEVLDVVESHQFAIARRQGEWKIIESPELIQARSEIKRLNEEMQRVKERTPKQPLILSYGGAVLSVSTALIITLWLRMELGQQSTPIVGLFLCAVMFSAWFGGVRLGLLATVLSLLAFDYYFVPPLYSLAVEIKEIPCLLIFTLSALFVGSLSATQRSKAESLRRARDVLDETVQEVKRTNVALRTEIAERKQAEEALRRSEAKFRAIFERANIGIALVDIEGRCVQSNPALQEMLGYSEEELRAMPFSQYTHPDDLSANLALFKHSMESGLVGYQLEKRFFRKDGQMVWVNLITSTIPGHEGEPTYNLGMLENITERKQAEEKLKQSESQLAEAQHMAHVGSWSWDLQSNALNWSDELYRIFGVAPQAFNPAYEDLVIEFVHVEDRALVRGVVENSLKTQEPFSFYYRILRLDGKDRVIHSRGDIVSDEHGNPIRVFGTAQDVTERRQAEERLIATTEQLRALSARIHSAKEEEGARIAREIHDELGAALTSLRWDLESFDKIISEAGDQSQLQALRERIEAMLRLTETIISTVRRISSELRPGVLDDLGLVAAIEWQAEQFQARTGIICRCDCSLENLDLSREQSTAVFRILQEALTNILRHAQATSIDITMMAEAGEFVLAIIDNGRGITEDERSGSQSLGLLGMQERAHLIGGKINVTGVEGGGTVITVRVPISG